MTPNESQSLQALVASLSGEVHHLAETVPDVYISKVEVRQMRRRLRMGLIANFVMGVIVVVAFWGFRTSDHRTVERFEHEAVATDQAFCALANNTRAETNKTRAAVRALEGAVRQSFELVQPSANATPADRARVLEFRRQILARLDGVEINGDLALLDCSGIGNGEVDFSVQDAITDLPPPPTTRPPE